MAQKIDLRQTKYVGTVDQVSSTASPEGDNIVSSVNSELTPLLRLSAQSTPSLVVSVGAGEISNAETNRRRAIPHVGAAYVQFTSGTITFPAASGGNIVSSPGGSTVLTVSSGNYAAVLIYLDGNGDLNTIQGAEAASESAAITNLPPPPDETLAAGFVVVQNVAGTIQNITQSAIRQFGTGSGGGGSGSGNEILESLKNYLLGSFFELVTPNIFRVDRGDKVDPSSTGAYSLIDRTFNIDSGETFVSTDMLDPEEFSTTDTALEEAELLTYWRLDNIDTAATYELSRNGGLDWQAVTMERVGTTDLYRGLHEFTLEGTSQVLASNATGASNLELDASTRQRLSQRVVIANKSIIRSVDLELTKLGSPAGFLIVSIVNDDGTGKPSLLSEDVLVEAAPIAMSSITTGALAVAIPETTIAAGDYHIVLRTTGYTATYSAGVTALRWDADSAASAPFMVSFNGTAWTIETNFKAKFSLEGLIYDLRVRITASANDKKLEGYGLFYDKTLSAAVADGQINAEVFEFSGSLNTTEFTLTKFVPHPDLLKVYDVNSGQVYTYGAFSLDGQKVIFESGQFLNPGETIKLRFMQIEGTVFDTSDANALLLASNFLGSTDATIDRSQPGRGIFLRRPDGTLREITIDNNDQIVIYSI